MPRSVSGMMSDMQSDLELYHFPISHFNEKARWALDWKGLPHCLNSQLPGLSKLAMKRLSGQEQVPVLRHGEKVVAGSNHIVAYLEELQPEPRLYPEDPKQRERALELQEWLDRDFGPAIRRARFGLMLSEKDYFAHQFTLDRSRAVQFAFRAMMPGIAIVMRKQMEITPEKVEESLEVTGQVFDRLQKEIGPSGYLVGDTFSIADLTAAALASPGIQPEGGPIYPRPAPPVVDEWLARWADHPTTAWVRGIYAKHR
ncbi:MAG: glutathione S-transferase family protein [bacterium]|nr:glutathione S-transferase family protein [bacterium]